MKIAFILGIFSVSLNGASLLTLSNRVADGSINTAGGNNIRSDWDNLSSYPADPDESLTPDFQTITIAHDTLNFYFRQIMHSSVDGFFSGNQIIAIDTDHNRSTGYRGAADSFAVGAEYILTGATLLAYTGDGTNWSWTTQGSLTSFDDFPTNDHEMTLSRALLGNAESFDFVAVTDYWESGDAYPNGGQGGSSGNYFTYTTIPEPAHALLCGIGTLLLLNRRRI